MTSRRYTRLCVDSCQPEGTCSKGASVCSCCHQPSPPSRLLWDAFVHILSATPAPLQMEKAVAHISSRVDELALQPEVYSARVEQQLTALATEQRALQVQISTKTVMRLLLPRACFIPSQLQVSREAHRRAGSDRCPCLCSSLAVPMTNGT